MVKADKKQYDVYYRSIIVAEDPEDNHETDWFYCGTTWAVSREKAINNVRFRRGFTSQYRPIDVGGRYEKYVEWDADLRGENAE